MKSKVIAVTGGIGSGKSEVLKYLSSLGYFTVDCDVLAKEVSARAETVEKVRQLLGDEYVVDGQLNRKAIRNKVFADKQLLHQYNSLFFTEVKNLLDNRISQYKSDLKQNTNKSKTIFVEISVFDAFDYFWDGVWLVEADVNARIDRVIERDGVSRQNIDDILHSQNVCTHYTLKIVNDGNLDYLQTQVTAALKTI